VSDISGPDEAFFEPSWHVTGADECRFYHVMELPEIGLVGEAWDLRATIDQYLGPTPLRGRSFLDLGCASGFISFEAERRGASVVSLDQRDARENRALVPFAHERHHRETFLVEAERILVRTKRAYWLAHRLLKSRARVCYASVYAMPAGLGEFDIVHLGQVLVHLPDPVRALASAANLARDRLILVEALIPDHGAKALFMPSIENLALGSWWRFSADLYRRVLRILGFEIESMVPAEHHCIAYQPARDVELFTITARRLSDPTPPAGAGERLEGLAGAAWRAADEFRRQALRR
jgi:SAM-dependent methyltransferase